MGEYSATQDFYKTDSDELVDVDTQVNYNLRRADSRVKSIVEWQHTNVPSISAEIPVREKGMKWYKFTTNSLWVARFDTGGGIWQHSVNGDVDDWSVTGITFANGYHSVDLETSRISYRQDPAEGSVEWRGRLMLYDFDNIPRNQNVVVMTVPSAIRPLRSKYFFVHSGFVGGSFAASRVLFNTNGNVEINRMGASTVSTSTERYVSFNDIYYPTNA